MMDWSGSVNRHREYRDLHSVPHASQTLNPPLFVRVCEDLNERQQHIPNLVGIWWLNYFKLIF